MNATVLHASRRLTVPAGFSGWWCERCSRGVSLPEELGSPARCPRCHKPTAVWVPPTAQRTEDGGRRTESLRPLTAARRAQLLAYMHLKADCPWLPDSLEEYEQEQLELGEAI